MSIFVISLFPWRQQSWFIYFFFASLKVCVFSFPVGTRYFLCANKESIQRKSSPVAGVTSEFWCFLACPVLIRLHAQQNRARRPWLALYLFLQKTPKLTHPHMGEVLAHTMNRGSDLISFLCASSVEKPPCAGYENKLAATQVRPVWGEPGKASLRADAGGRIA